MEFDILCQSPASTVSHNTTLNVVLKCAPTSKRLACEPHDIRKEVRVLSSLDHPGIATLLDVFTDDDGNLAYYMPYLPFSLINLLECPAFSPYPFTARFGEGRDFEAEQRFTTIARSLILQALVALAYLHKNRIAHRDVKPENFLIAPDGYIKAIDFGIAYQEGEPDPKDIWPEPRDKLYFEVSTGCVSLCFLFTGRAYIYLGCFVYRAYRAPELIFGTRTYNPFVIDLWSFGATLASFFTPLRLSSPDDDADDDEDTHELFIIPSHLKFGTPDTYWSRDTLYNASRSEIGLAWSIFKVHGTPNEDSWPEWNSLPQSRTLAFNVVEGKGLVRELLPHLIPEEERKGSDRRPEPTVADLMNRFLRYPYRARLSFADALSHPWFTSSGTLLIPSGYRSAVGQYWDAALIPSGEIDEPPRLKVEQVWKPTVEEKTNAKKAMENAMAGVWKEKTLVEYISELSSSTSIPS